MESLEELSFMDLETKAELEAVSLPLGEQKLLEIARALATSPRLLLLDDMFHAYCQLLRTLAVEEEAWQWTTRQLVPAPASP